MNTLIPARTQIQAQIADHYRRLIRNGELREGDRLPTVRQVAQERGFSTTPVKMAFQRLEQEGLVFRRRGAGTFVGPRPSSLPRTLEIGVVFRPLPKWTNFDNYGLRLFQGIHEAVNAEQHRTLLVTRSDETPYDPEEQLPHQFLEYPPQAYVLDEHVPDGLVQLYVATGRPVVTVNRRCDVAGAGSVYRDDAEAGKIAAEQIWQAGHRITSCIFRQDPTGHAARESFVRTMTELGAPPGSGYVQHADPHLLGKQQVDARFAGIMAQQPMPTAIFVTNDRTAYAFMRWARQVGLRIPEDVSLVGNLDLAFAAEIVPRLSTVRFEPEQVGAQAVRQAIRCCVETGALAEQELVHGEWVQRDSLVPPSSSEEKPIHQN